MASGGHQVRINDVGRAISRYRTDDANGTAPINRFTDPLSVPPATGHHPAFDRSPKSNPVHPWDVGPPDGMIRIFDVTAVITQYRHDCA